MIKGTNGALTLAFLSSMAISAIGLFIYWILTVKSRMLQFGIFIGNINSKIFMSRMNSVTNTKDQILPLQLISFGKDYLKMGILFGGIILAVIILMGIYISTIKMDQAIKLGED